MDISPAIHEGICEHEPLRDRWGRPVINGIPHRRPSTLAGMLDDKSSLIAWKARQTAIGIALPQSQDLRDLVLSHREDNTVLNTAVESSLERSGATGAANRGVSLHAILARVNRGQEIPLDIPHGMANSVREYQRVLGKLEIHPISAEVFVVDAGRRIAGSFDVLVEWRGRRYIADIKTGAKLWDRQYARPVAMQLAAYQGGQPYCPLSGYLEPHRANPELGLLISVPVDAESCLVDTIDLETGRIGLDIAERVFSFRNMQPRKDIVE